MINYINNLKTKPEHIRRRFAFTFSFAFTFIVFAGWVASFGLVSNPVLTEKEINKNTNSKVAIDQPVTSLTATAVGAWDDIKSVFLGSNKVEFTNDSIEVLPGNR